MINFYKLYTGHLKSSKRVLLIASIGLICALTIVSSTNYYFDTSKQLVIEDYLKSNSFNGNQADNSFTLNGNLDSYNQSMKDLANSINKTKNEFNINYFKSIVIHPAVANLMTPVGYYGQSIPNQVNMEGNSSVLVTQLTPTYEQDINQLISTNPMMSNSKLPTEGNGNATIPKAFVVMIGYYSSTPSAIVNITNSQITLYNLFGNSGVKLDITGVAGMNLNDYYCNSGPCVKNPNADKYANIKEFFYATNNQGAQAAIFVPNLQNFLNYLKTNEPANESSYNPHSMNYGITMDFDYSKIDPYSASSIITNINQFNQALQDRLINLNEFSSISYNFNSEGLFQSIQGAITGFIFGLFLVSIPILIATIFVINYSFGLINKNVVQQIGVYKTRGGGSWLMFMFQLIDNVIIIVLSILVALIAGVPLAMLTLKTNYLLSFNYPAPSYYVLNYQAVTSLLVYVSIALIIIVNLRRVKRLSQMSITETENTTDKEDPFWKRHYLDVWLFGFGMVMYTIFYELVKSPNTASLLGLFVIILSILLIPTPFAIVIGLILLVNRIVPVFLNKIGTVLWERTGDLLAFSFKNVIRHRQASTRAVMLISILIAFIIFFYALPYSSLVSNEQNLFYQYGAQGNAQFGPDGYNSTTLSIIQENFSQYLTGFTPYVILSAGNPGSGNTIMLVNTSTYLKTAYLNFDLGLTKGINKDFQNLKINSSNFSNLNVLIDSNSLNNRKASIGSNITISGKPTNLGLHIIDSFHHWPVVEYNSYFQSNQLYGIGDISYYTSYLNENLNNTPLNSVQSQGVLFNFKDGVNQSVVSGWITGNTSLSNFYLESISQEQYYSGVQFRLQIGQVNNDVLMTLVIAVIVFTMFAYLQLNERRKELFTERALGMKLHQTAMLFFIETIILSITSIILGIVVGFFLMELIALFMGSPLQSYPTYQLVFPVDLIIMTNALILLCSILVSIIPAIYVWKKQDISKSFGEV